MRRRTRRRHLPWFVLLAELGLVSGQAACTGDPGIEESASDATTTATSTSMTTTSTPTGSPTTTTTTTTSTSSTSIGPSCDCPPEDPDECPPGGDELLSQGLVRCLDSTCAEVDEVYFEDLSIFSGFEDELSHELECDVRDRVVEGDGAEVWRLRDCAGIDPAAEFGLLLRFQSSLPVGLPLSIGERVKLSVHRASIYGRDHRSWSLRTLEGDLLAAASWGLWLPRADHVAPFVLTGRPLECGTGPVCGGYSGRSSVALELDNEVVIIDDGYAAEAGPYHAIVAYARYGGYFGCGVFGWEETYHLAIVAGS